MMGESYRLTPIVVGMLTAIMVSSPALAAPAAQPSVEDRLQRIERIIENPVLLQLSRRLGEQQREIQELQDQIDFLKRDLRRLTQTSDKRYKESDDRLSALESETEVLKQEKEARLELSMPVIPSLAVTPALSVDGASAIVTDEESGSITPQEAGQVLSQKNAQETLLATDQKPTTEEQAKKISEPTFTPITTHPATEQEKGVYQLAFGLLKNSQYDNAIKAFQSFLDSYPKSELASNSAYWMGEAYYIKQDNQAALNAFNRVIKRYPFSSKVPDAMLRAGDCYDNLGQQSQAKELYAELIALYPKTRAAEKAIKRLEK